MNWVGRPRARGDGRGVYRGILTRRSVITNGTTPFLARNNSRFRRGQSGSIEQGLLNAESNLIDRLEDTLVEPVAHENMGVYPSSSGVRDRPMAKSNSLKAGITMASVAKL
jgi:hypothetical protein